MFLTLLPAMVALPATASGNHNLLERASVGPIGGNGASVAAFRGASADGSTIFFATSEQLDSTDTDSSFDVYQRKAGTTTLVSIGPNGGNGAVTAEFVGASADGSRVFFRTTESLVSTDTDINLDVYERSGGTTKIVSQGPIGGNGATDAFYRGSSPDGTRVWFVTFERLVTEDADLSRRDVYERTNGTTTTLISTGPAGGAGAFGADFSGASQDGSRVFFFTDEKLTTNDTDADFQDVYERNGSTTNLISTSPTGGSAGFRAFFGGATPDGSKVWFRTEEQLVAADTDSTCPDDLGNPTRPCSDVYERSGGTTALVSTSATSPNGPYSANFGGASADGSKVYFTTEEPLDPSDTDNFCEDENENPVLRCVDVYERWNGNTTFVSTSPTSPNSAHNAAFKRVSNDGTRVLFQTGESLGPGDSDGLEDVYERSGGTLTKVSTSATGGNGGFTGEYLGSSSDGRRVFFQTNEALTPNDTDGTSLDYYERLDNAITTLISTGPASPNGDPFMLFGGNTSDGTRVFFTTEESLLPGDTDGLQDVYVSRERPYDAPAAASPIAVSLIPALRLTASDSQCLASGRTPSVHGAPLAMISCQPPAYLPGVAAKIGDLGVASASLNVVPGNLATSADEADVTFGMSATDIRSRQTGLDYNPNPAGADVTLIEKLRLSDMYNGPGLNEPGTTTTFEFPVPVECAPTADPVQGGTCLVNVSADSIAPGAIVEGKNMVLQVFRIRVEDAGPNGTRGDSDDRLFAHQGIYIP